MRTYKHLAVFIVGTLSVSLNSVSAAPAILEARIDPAASTVKVYHASEEFLTEIQEKVDAPIPEAFEKVLADAEQLNVQSITGAEPKTMGKALILSPALHSNEKYILAAPIAVSAEALDRINGSAGGAFIQIALPGKLTDNHAQPQQEATSSESEDTSSNSEDESDDDSEQGTKPPPSYRPPGITAPEENPHTPTLEESIESFLQRFLKLDLSEDNKFIPETVRTALAASQQLIVHPTSYLQVPEGVTGADDQMFTITSATPVNVIFGLFDRRYY